MDKIKTVIICDTPDARGEMIRDAAERFFSERTDATVFTCSSMKIENCIGCFACRYKTPGKCIFSDDMAEIIKALVEADSIVLISGIRFGCYTPQMKRVLDRLIPFETPFLRIHRRETHLTPRYPKIRNLTVIGYADTLDKEEAILFTNLAYRNSLNLGADYRRSVFIRGGEDISKKITEKLGGLSWKK